jgi:hypothetical protein
MERFGLDLNQLKVILNEAAFYEVMSRMHQFIYP